MNNKKVYSSYFPPAPLLVEYDNRGVTPEVIKQLQDYKAVLDSFYEKVCVDVCTTIVQDVAAIPEEM